MFLIKLSKSEVKSMFDYIPIKYFKLIFSTVFIIINVQHNWLYKWLHIFQHLPST